MDFGAGTVYVSGPWFVRRSKEDAMFAGSRRLGRKTLVGLAAAVLALLPVLGVSSPASASASNCLGGIDHPALFNGARGNYCVIVFGKGMTVTRVHGVFTDYTKAVCNWQITAEFFDANYKWYKTFTTAKHKGCSRHSSDDLTGKYKAKGSKGHICSTLKDNGHRVASYCFNLHK